MKFSQIVNQLQNWLPIAKSKIEESASQLDVTNITENQEDILPTRLIQRLNRKLVSLPVYNIYEELLEKDLADVIGDWLNNYDYKNKNCLIIKSNPVDHFGKIISQIFQKQDTFIKEQNSCEYQILSTSDLSLSKEQRLIVFRENLDKIKSQCQQKIIIIPELSYYFSRTVTGLETIEVLLHLIDRSERKLWIIGCNHWLWLFMSKIYHWDDYIQQLWDFPSLSAQNLQTLLEPVLNLVELNWDKMKKYLLELSPQEENEETTINKIKNKYYANLANLSKGCFTIASQLCFYSLRYHQEKEEAQSFLVIKNPRFPSLPKIRQSERYVLFCLGLHHHLSKQDIALILADNQVYLNAQIQSLLNLNLIIFCDDKHLIINPLYFYKIEQDLKDNHFLVSI